MSLWHCILGHSGLGNKVPAVRLVTVFVCLSGPELPIQRNTQTQTHGRLINDPWCRGGCVLVKIITVSTLSLASVSLVLCLKSVWLQGMHVQVMSHKFTDSA